MNPYTTPTGQSDLEHREDHESASDPLDHPYYDFVLKKVLWGEDREEVYRSLAVNGVTGGIADRLYEHARADRIRTIRGDYTRKLLVGLGLILAVGVIFSSCWFGLGFIPKILLYACFAGLGIGAWKSIDGLSGYLMAPGKTGSVADDI